MCDLTHTYVWHASYICVTWLIHMCDLTHSYVWPDSFICVTCLMYLMMLLLAHFDVLHDEDKLLCFKRLIRLCDITHTFMWHDSYSYTCTWWRCCWPILTCCMMKTSCLAWRDSYVCVTWLIQMCDVTHTYVWHASYKCVTWLIHMCDMPYVPDDAAVGPFWRAAWWRQAALRETTHMSYDPYVCVTSRIHMYNMTHTYITLYLIALLLAHLDVLHDENKLLFHIGGQATAEKISLRFDIKYFRHISESCSWETQTKKNVRVWTLSVYIYVYRVAKTHRIPYLYRSFSAKETYI